MKIQVAVFWVVTSYSVWWGTKLSEECAAFIFTLKIKAALHGVTIQKTTI